MKKSVKEIFIVIVILITLYLVLNNQKILKSSFGGSTIIKSFWISFGYNIPFYVKNSYSIDNIPTEFIFSDPYIIPIKTGKSVFLKTVYYDSQIYSGYYDLLYYDSNDIKHFIQYKWFKFNIFLKNKVKINTMLEKTDLRIPVDIYIDNRTVSKLELDLVDENTFILRAYVVVKYKKKWSIKFYYDTREEELCHWVLKPMDLRNIRTYIA